MLPMATEGSPEGVPRAKRAGELMSRKRIPNRNAATGVRHAAWRFDGHILARGV